MPHHTCAPVTIFHHMSTCHYVYPPIDLSTLHMHSCPDCEAANMSLFGTNLSRLRHHSAAGAPGGDTVSPCSHSTSYVSVRGLCIKRWTHRRVQMSNISEEGQRIQCKKGALASKQRESVPKRLQLFLTTVSAS